MEYLRGAVLRDSGQLAAHWLILELRELACRLDCMATAVDPGFAHLDRGFVLEQTL